MKLPRGSMMGFSTALITNQSAVLMNDILISTSILIHDIMYPRSCPRLPLDSMEAGAQKNESKYKMVSLD